LVLKLKFLHEARSVGENIYFGQFENANAGRTPVQAVDERDLFPKVFDRHAARDLETLRVIRDADIFIAMLLRGSRHLLDRMRPIARCGMCVKLATGSGWDWSHISSMGQLRDSRIGRYLAEAQPARGSARTTGGDGVSEPFSAIVAIAGRGPQTLDEGERDIVLALTG
jgi:hypothetical protein